MKMKSEREFKNLDFQFLATQERCKVGQCLDEVKIAEKN